MASSACEPNPVKNTVDPDGVFQGIPLPTAARRALSPR